MIKFILGVLAGIFGTYIFIVIIALFGEDWLNESPQAKARREAKQAQRFWDGVVEDQRGRHLLRAVPNEE